MLQTMPFPTSQEMLKALALLMLWRSIGEGEHALLPSNNSPPALLVQAQQFILTHLQEPITLQQIAQASAVSPFHLIRLFQKHLSLTPIGTIASQYGFQSRYHFSRRIRQEIRRQHTLLHSKLIIVGYNTVSITSFLQRISTFTGSICSV